MTILFDATRRVKSARPFAQGLRLSEPRRQPYTAEDAAWWASNSPANRRGYDVIGRSDASLEFAAGCFAVGSLMDAGFPVL
jgi:hypothetical protein